MATLSQLESPLVEELNIIEGHMPDYLLPGTVFLFSTEQAKSKGEDGFYIAALSCPRCESIGLLTPKQLYGGESMICQGKRCSAEYHIDGELIIFRRPQ